MLFPSNVSGEERCVTTRKTAATETTKEMNTSGFLCPVLLSVLLLDNKVAFYILIVRKMECLCNF